jgi:hypothetical protein
MFDITKLLLKMPKKSKNWAIISVLPIVPSNWSEYLEGAYSYFFEETNIHAFWVLIQIPRECQQN